MVDGDTRKPDPEKVEAINAFPEPLNRTGVQRFLGMTGYYRDFVDNYAKRTVALRGLTKDDVPHRWSKLGEAARKEFEDLKEEMMSERVVFHHPDREADFYVHS